VERAQVDLGWTKVTSLVDGVAGIPASRQLLVSLPKILASVGSFLILPDRLPFFFNKFGGFVFKWMKVL